MLIDHYQSNDGRKTMLMIKSHHFHRPLRTTLPGAFNKGSACSRNQPDEGSGKSLAHK